MFADKTNNLKLSETEKNFLLNNVIYIHDLNELIDENLYIKSFAQSTRSRANLQKSEKKISSKKTTAEIKQVKLKGDSKPVFEKIKKKIEFMKRFFPELYNRHENIITLWGSLDYRNLADLKTFNLRNTLPQYLLI